MSQVVKMVEEETVTITAKDVFAIVDTLRKNELPHILHIDDVVKILRCSRYVVEQLIQHKHMPAVRIGKHYKIPRDAFFETLNRMAQEHEKFVVG